MFNGNEINVLWGVATADGRPLTQYAAKEVPHLSSGAAHRRTTCITVNQRYGGIRQNFGWKRCVKDKWVTGGELHRAVRKREITVPGGPIQSHRALSGSSVDNEESNHQEQKPQWDHPGQSKAAVCRKEWSWRAQSLFTLVWGRWRFPKPARLTPHASLSFYKQSPSQGVRDEQRASIFRELQGSSGRYRTWAPSQLGERSSRQPGPSEIPKATSGYIRATKSLVIIYQQ